MFPFVCTRCFWNLYIQKQENILYSDFSPAPPKTLIESATSSLPQSRKDTMYCLPLLGHFILR